jgi:hypothetical protein
MPGPVPVLVLRVWRWNAMHKACSFGAALLQDAVARAVSVSQNAGFALLLVHALDDKAPQCYLHYGFVESPFAPIDPDAAVAHGFRRRTPY